MSVWLTFSLTFTLQGSLCRNDDEEDIGIICELFAPVEDGFIHAEEIPYNPQRYRPLIPVPTVYGLTRSQKNEDDYALELQEFIAKTDGQGYYEFNIENLRPGECKWLCCGLLIRPVDGAISITYQIHSAHSTGKLTDTLEWHEN